MESLLPGGHEEVSPHLLTGAIPASRPAEMGLEFLAAVPDIRRLAVSRAMRSGLSYADAEDIAQDTLFDLYRYISREGEEPRSLLAWSSVVAARRAIHRRSGLNREIPAGNSLPDGVLDDQAQIADVLAERDQIRRWVGKLPGPQQQVIALFMDGYQADEIGRMLQVPVSLVRVRQRTAIEKLRKDLVVQMSADDRAEQAQQAEERAAVVRAVAQARMLPPTKEPALQGVLAALPPRQKEVLQLSRRGYKPAQIARLLGLSPNTVRVNLCHARKNMREAMGEAVEEERSREGQGAAGENSGLEAESALRLDGYCAPRTPAELIDAIRRFRARAGNPSFRKMSERSGGRVRPSAMCEALKGNSLPRLTVIDAIVRGCEGAEEDRKRFALAWRDLALDEFRD